MNAEITIVDRGHGPQLSTSRITVQDLVPYFQLKYSYDEILKIMPTLSIAEIQAVERYVDEHREEVLEEDRRLRERSATRRNPPHVEALLRQSRERRLALQERLRSNGHEDGNGAGHPL
ncbi:MAG: DUF433 domain-containing protein [Pirellulales bacterium]